MENIFPFFISGVYILLILGLATLLTYQGRGSTENSRKFIHILVGNWVFITPMFTSLWAASLIPFAFIIINSLSIKFKLIKAMEREDDSLGTVFYAISLFVLVTLSYLLNWPLLSFIGILTMAYGDGLAAIVGKRWGKWKPFSIAPDKSFLGSLTVFTVNFILCILSLTVFSDFFRIPRTLGLGLALFLSLASGLFSVLLELNGKRGCDNLTLPIGSGIFISLTVYLGTWSLLVYLGISALILAYAYKHHAITLDGIIAAFLTALTLYSFGGVWVATSLLVFFILGSIISKIKNQTKSSAETRQEAGSRRNWKQVLANSLPASLLLWLYFLLPNHDYLLLLSIGVFAAAQADTFSSELGMLSKDTVYDILTREKLPRGVSGGVSRMGLIAGVLGSLLLSLLAFPTFGWRGFIIATLLGILGSLLDSLVGSLLQRKYKDAQGRWQDIAHTLGEAPAQGLRFISNNTVNLITLTLVSLAGMLYFIFI